MVLYRLTDHCLRPTHSRQPINAASTKAGVPGDDQFSLGARDPYKEQAPLDGIGNFVPFQSNKTLPMRYHDYDEYYIREGISLINRIPSKLLNSFFTLFSKTAMSMTSSFIAFTIKSFLFLVLDEEIA